MAQMALTCPRRCQLGFHSQWQEVVFWKSPPNTPKWTPYRRLYPEFWHCAYISEEGGFTSIKSLINTDHNQYSCYRDLGITSGKFLRLWMQKILSFDALFGYFGKSDAQKTKNGDYKCITFLSACNSFKIFRQMQYVLNFSFVGFMMSKFSIWIKKHRRTSPNISKFGRDLR